jgi:hypothetical protein
VTQSLPKGIKWTNRYYSDDIPSQIAALRDVGSHRKMIIHADNAGPHVSICVTEYMDHNSLKKAGHPPYSPDLAASDFYRFGQFRRLTADLLCHHLNQCLLKSQPRKPPALHRGRNDSTVRLSAPANPCGTPGLFVITSTSS